VDQVVGRAGECAKTLHAARKVWQVVEDVVLVDVAAGSRVDVDDARAGRVLDDVGDVWRLSTGEDVDGDVSRGQRSAQLTHVDVHAARLPAAQWRQGTCVRAQDGNSQRHRAQPILALT